jgi:1-acyl-sn-glycerol-3-phosphate acyltransferase
MSPLAGMATLVRHQLDGTNTVDEWGMDASMASVARDFAGLRWRASVGGAHHIPEDGGALVVANRRLFGATPLLVAAALGRATGRAVRFVGIPDIAPAGPLLRRLGGVLARPDEVAGLLRAGELAAVFCEAHLTTSQRVGRVPDTYLAAALTEGAPVVPVAVLAPLLAYRVRVEVGPPVPARHSGGPLATADLADAVRLSIQRMVDEATPPSWFFSRLSRAGRG